MIARVHNVYRKEEVLEASAFYKTGWRCFAFHKTRQSTCSMKQSNSAFCLAKMMVLLATNVNGLSCSSNSVIIEIIMTVTRAFRLFITSIFGGKIIQSGIQSFQ